MATLEQILSEARSLPVAEQRKLRDELDRNLSSQPKSYNPRKVEMKWIEEHREQYLGQWIVVEGETLIASGASGREVAEAARAAGIKIPFLVRVEPKTENFWGGWL